MPYDLVPAGASAPTGAPPSLSPNDSAWDIPPELDPSLRAPGLRHSERSADHADMDAADARETGDVSFASVRETDAAEKRQTVWDWGDTRTWLWIAAMFFGFLLLTAFVYFMPYGTHNQSDGANGGQPTTPTIRVY